MRRFRVGVMILGLSIVVLTGMTPASGQQSDEPQSLKELAGAWEVVSADGSAGQNVIFPAESGLSEKGNRLTIRGNALVWQDKIVATLTTDFSATGLGVEKQVWTTRQPILFTLPDGKGILCAYEVRSGALTIVYPHTLGRVGAGTWLTLKRPDSK